MARAEEENTAAVPVNDGDGSNYQGVAVADAATLAWSGYLLVAAPVVAASWAGGVVDEPVAAVLAYALLLFGVAFIILAMAAPAKPKMI